MLLENQCTLSSRIAKLIVCKPRAVVAFFGHPIKNPSWERNQYKEKQSQKKKKFGESIIEISFELLAPDMSKVQHSFTFLNSVKKKIPYFQKPTCNTFPLLAIKRILNTADTDT